MGRFSIEFQVANNNDIANEKSGFVQADQVRRKVIRGVVDSGAAVLVLPASVGKELGLPLSPSKTKVKYADGRQAVRDEADAVYLEIQGRHGVFSAVLEPKRKDALIGAIVLEALDFLVDSRAQRLVPRDPRYHIAEIE